MRRPSAWPWPALLRRLVLLNLPARRPLMDGLERLIDNHTKLALGGAAQPALPVGGRDLAEDVLAAALDQAIAAHGGPAWGPASFEALVAAVRADAEPSARKGVIAAGRIISKLQELGRRTEEMWAHDGRTGRLRRLCGRRWRRRPAPGPPGRCPFREPGWARATTRPRALPQRDRTPPGQAPPRPPPGTSVSPTACRLCSGASMTPRSRPAKRACPWLAWLPWRKCGG